MELKRGNIFHCIWDLPDDMEFIDLTECSRKIVTVKQLLERHSPDDPDCNYKLCETLFDYGRTKSYSVRCGLYGVYNQVGGRKA